MAASCRYKMMQGNTIDWSMVFLFLVTRETIRAIQERNIFMWEKDIQLEELNTENSASYEEICE